MEITVDRFLDLKVSGFSSKEVDGIWICEPSLVEVRDSFEVVSDEFGSSEGSGDVSRELSTADGNEIERSEMGKKGMGKLDKAEKSALIEIVLKNVMMTRNDSERLVGNF